MSQHRLNAAQVAEVLTMRAPDQATSQEGTSDEVDLLHSGWHSTEEMAALLRVDPSTLRRWRTARPPLGPPFVKLANRHYTYSAADAQAWLAEQRTVPGQAA